VTQPGEVPFQGEMMHCIMCQKEEKSDPHVESGWTTIDLDGKRFYICPLHLGNPHWTRKEHKRNWESVMRRITSLLMRDAPW
jgi:hypothetical protein